MERKRKIKSKGKAEPASSTAEARRQQATSSSQHRDSSRREQVAAPTGAKERFVVLDALRGLALLGIVLANFPEFGLWTFLLPAEQGAMPTAGVDRAVRFLSYMLVDGKFYTIFSMLFGIGFALILSHHGRRLFVRRMLVLAVIGALHLLFIWSGDILLLYAIGGLLLSLLTNLSDRTLLWTALALIILPVGLDALTEFGGVDFAAPFYAAWWHEAGSQGITEENFAAWLRDAENYPQMFAFLRQGALERVWEFVGGHRLPKVLGLFILGYLVGKNRLFARLGELPLARLLRRVFFPSLLLSALYAWSSTHSHPWGLTVHSTLYAVSVIPLAFCYVAAFCRAFLSVSAHQKGAASTNGLFALLASPGRMALTSYIGQSFAGIVLFYGIGFGLGTRLGLVYIELIACGVFLLQVVVSRFWLRFFRFGPLEWLWRMLTYGRYFSIRETK